MSGEQKNTAIDYDRLMRENLSRVFNEVEAEKRLQAIQELYTADATLYEPSDSSVQGHEAINSTVDALRRNLPPSFAFTAAAPAMAHHGVGALRWQGGTPEEPAALSGIDVAKFDGGRIHALYVFIDPPANE
jgi:uncharacterized protein YgbK (DUF1537 family)